jgi:hypothetical protein
LFFIVDRIKINNNELIFSEKMSERKKEINTDEFKNILKPNEELSFGIKSPISPITTPPKTIFTAWHGNLLINCTGTCYVCRDDSNHWNFDVYSIRPKGNTTILEIINLKQDYHCIEKGYKNIPEFLRNHIPTNIEKKLKNKDSNKNV